MARPISVQLYSLREEAKQDFPGTLKFLSDVGYVGVEFAGLHGRKAGEVRKWLDDLGLKASSAHTSAFDVSKANEIIDDARALGYSAVGCGFGPKDFENETTIKAAAERANRGIERLSAAGLRVQYHNHWWEWEDPKKGELLLKLCPKLYVQLDIYWAQTGGQDPAALIRKFAGRVLSIHVKDGPCEKGRPHTAVGQGKVNTKAVLAAAEKTPSEWYIVELDSCASDMRAAVRDSYNYLVGSGLATGRRKAADFVSAKPGQKGELL